MILQLVDFRLYYVAPQFILIIQSCIYVSEKWSTEMCTYHMWLCTGDSVHHTRRRKYQTRTDWTVLCRPGCKTRSYCSRSSIVSQWLHLENLANMIKESPLMDKRMLLIGRPILCLLVVPALSVHRPCVWLLVCRKLPKSANYVGSQTFQNQNVFQDKIRVQWRN